MSSQHFWHQMCIFAMPSHFLVPVDTNWVVYNFILCWHELWLQWTPGLRPPSHKTALGSDASLKYWVTWSGFTLNVYITPWGLMLFSLSVHKTQGKSLSKFTGDYERHKWLGQAAGRGGTQINAPELLSLWSWYATSSLHMNEFPNLGVLWPLWIEL